MNCEVIKVGTECAFMTKKGCSFNGGKCHPVVDQCKGCGRIGVFSAGEYCVACPDPSMKWASRDCNLATHVVKEKIPQAAKAVDPLKASKRKAAGR